VTEINGKKVWFERHHKDEWFDEVTIRCVERYKQSGLSGDEWRFSYVVQFKRKGVVMHEDAWNTLKSALLGIGGASLAASDRPMGIEWEEKTGEPDSEWCGQPGCPNRWTKVYQRVCHYVDGYDVTSQRSGAYDPVSEKMVPLASVIGFCSKHWRRGDANLNDRDSNYEVIQVKEEPK